jgi:hypothetical protein
VAMSLTYLSLTKPLDRLHWSANRKKNRFLFKFSDSYNFDIDESEYDNQIALSPTNVKGGGIKLKSYVCNKKKQAYNIAF